MVKRSAAERTSAQIEMIEMRMLQINNLSATVADKPIFKGLSLTVNAGAIQAVMGMGGA